MNYHHLTIEERSCIRKYYVEGLSYRKIAELIGRSPSTVSREINRNRTHMYDIPTYYPHTAQKKYLLRRSYCHRGMFHSQEVVSYIEEKLLATWSPSRSPAHRLLFQCPVGAQSTVGSMTDTCLTGTQKCCAAKENHMGLKKQRANSAKESLFASGIRVCAVEKKPVIGK